MSQAPLLSRRGAVISGSELGVLSGAADVLARARVTAARQQQVVEAARTQGWKEGFERGRAEAIKGALERLAEAARRAEADIARSEDRISAVVMRALELILGALDQDERSRLLIRQAMRDCARAERIVVHVPVAEEAAIARAVEGLGDQLEVRADRLLNAGELVLETRQGRRHIGMQDQLLRLQSLLSP